MIEIRRSHRQREMGIILKENGRSTAQILQFQCLDILIVNQNVAFGGVVQAGDKLQNGAFAGAVLTDYDLHL